jgi:F-type H+-transporting ATPase subunit b
MGDIFSKIGQAFVQAIPTVVFVGLLVFILRRIFFRPLGEVLQEREQQGKGGLERARERTALAESKAAEYEAVWQKARRELYAVREQERRAPHAAREEVIRQARAQSEATVKEAQASLAREAELVRADLSRNSAALATQIVDTIMAGPDSQPAADEVRR